MFLLFDSLYNNINEKKKEVGIIKRKNKNKKK